MKKNVKAIFAGLAAAALLAGFSSCSNGSSDDPTSMPESSDIYSGGVVTFDINQNSTNAAKTNLVLMYTRSAIGAKEQINLIDAELEVKVDGTSVSMPSSIGFYLDEYSSFVLPDGQKENDTSKQKQYKCTLSLGKQLASGNKVTIQLKKARLAGEGINAVNAGSILATIVDTDEAVNYWKALSDTTTSFISMKNGKDLNAKEPEPTTPVTVTNCKAYTVNVALENGKPNITDASVVALLFQLDNDGSQDENGLKVTISDLELTVKVGTNEPITVTKDSLELVPNQYADPTYSKTDGRFRLGLTNELPVGTSVVIQIKKATISNKDKKDSIIFALQRDADSYDIVGPSWQPIFAAAE